MMEAQVKDKFVLNLVALIPQLICAKVRHVSPLYHARCQKCQGVQQLNYNPQFFPCQDLSVWENAETARARFLSGQY